MKSIPHVASAAIVLHDSLSDQAREAVRGPFAPPVVESPFAETENGTTTPRPSPNSIRFKKVCWLPFKRAERS